MENLLVGEQQKTRKCAEDPPKKGDTSLKKGAVFLTDKMPAAAATDRVSGLLRNAQISGQINNTPSSQALVKSESRQLIDQVHRAGFLF